MILTFFKLFLILTKLGLITFKKVNNLLPDRFCQLILPNNLRQHLKEELTLFLSELSQIKLTNILSNNLIPINILII